MKTVDYNKGKWRDMIGALCEKFEVDKVEAWQFLRTEFPELTDETHCPNCDALMAEYIFRFDILDAILISQMGELVRERLAKGLDFSIANQIMIQELPVSLSIKCRTTHCSKLGLITQLKNEHDKKVPGVWLITKRGFAALKGDPVPAMVKVWRGKIDERFDITTTLSEAFKLHRDKVDALQKAGKVIKNDYRTFSDTYDPKGWVDIDSYRAGRIL